MVTPQKNLTINSNKKMCVCVLNIITHNNVNIIINLLQCISINDKGAYANSEAPAVSL